MAKPTVDKMATVTREQFDKAVNYLDPNHVIIIAYADQLVAEIAMLNDHLSDDEIQMGKTATHITEQDAMIDRMAYYISNETDDCQFCPKFEKCRGRKTAIEECPGAPTETDIKRYFAEGKT